MVERKNQVVYSTFITQARNKILVQLIAKSKTILLNFKTGPAAWAHMMLLAK